MVIVLFTGVYLDLLVSGVRLRLTSVSHTPAIMAPAVQILSITTPVSAVQVSHVDGSY